MADEADAYLCFGDEIALQLIPKQSEVTPHIGYLSVRFGSSTVNMNYLPPQASSVLATCTPLHARRVRFTVVPPKHYEERMKCEAALQEVDQYLEDDLQQIMTRAKHENANNRSDLKRLRGQRIAFGQRINLVRCNIGRFYTPRLSL